MTAYRNHNFSGLQPEAHDGDVFEDCNLAQAEPGTVLFEGMKGLTFRRCNLARAVVPGDSTIEDCNTTQRAIPIEVEAEEEITVPLKEWDRLKAVDAAQEIARG